MAFAGCSKLSLLVIPDSVTYIDDFAFTSCSGLKNVEIGTGVTFIGKGAFYKCNNISYVFFKNTNNWRVLPDANSNIGLTLSSSELYFAATAAEYLTSTSKYCAYYWKRS